MDQSWRDDTAWSPETATRLLEHLCEHEGTASCRSALAYLHDEVTRLTTPPEPSPTRETPAQYMARQRARIERGGWEAQIAYDALEHDQLNHALWVRNVNDVMKRLASERAALRAALRAIEVADCLGDDWCCGAGHAQCCAACRLAGVAAAALAAKPAP